MTNYKVTSHKLAGYQHGDTVSADELEHVNVPALIAGGHLAAATTKNSRKANNEESEA
tara:strand:- start:363 stop:536 length:174 start_codon:yes stop_codon:yes gene_type:complete